MADRQDTVANLFLSRSLKSKKEKRMAGVPPGKPLTTGLDFSGQSYVDLAKKAEEDVSRAHEVIREKLPLFAQLRGLISLTFGDRPAVFLDARSDEAKLLEQCSDEPDTKLNVNPECKRLLTEMSLGRCPTKTNADIIQFYRGELEPRYGLFKDAFFHSASMPQGNIPLAIKFADLLTPTPPTAPLKVTPETFPRLPQPTEDIDQVKRDVLEFGYGLVRNALTPEQVAILKRAVQEQAAGETAAGVGNEDGGGPNQRIWTLVNKGDEFLDFLDHPLIDAIVPWFLGEHALVHSYSAKYFYPPAHPNSSV